MSASDVTTAYRAVIAAISAGEMDRLDQLIAPDLVDHNPVPGQSAGLVGFKDWADSARDAFPDLIGTVEDIVADGDMVAGRVTWRGRHRGEFVGVPGTGVRVEFSAFHLVRFSGGLAVEWWGTADILGALIQVGATVAPPVETDLPPVPTDGTG